MTALRDLEALQVRGERPMFDKNYRRTQGEVLCRFRIDYLSGTLQ
ncbi:MAG: hypothetical protein ACREVV_17640 [Steroidobacteraceae bacterium]